VALNPVAYRALLNYIAEVPKQPTGRPHTVTVKDAVVLTTVQQKTLETVLTAYWGKPYPCPLLLDIKPRHGYESRVLKDGYPPMKYLEWLTAGCSDVAIASADTKGRPRLLIPVTDEMGQYRILVPLRSDTFGVHVDDVIPLGLKAKK